MDLPILPTTRVAELLDRYPELEEVLIAFSPAFVKLKNPLLRKSVGKVASLKQAAAVAGVPVSQLVNGLRAAAGQSLVDVQEDDNSAEYFTERPEWFDPGRIVALLDDTQSAGETRMPLVHVFERARKMKKTEILELITAHLPAPGIDIMRKRGFRVWCTRVSAGPVHSYF